MATALKNHQTMDFKSLAIQAQQLKDNTGAAVNMTELTALTGAKATELANFATHVTAGSTKTLTSADNGKWIDLDTATGSVVTLPAASGTGAKFRFRVKVLATSNSHIVKVANSSDTMQGLIFTVDDSSDNGQGFIAGATADTITLNRTTTGSVSLGEWFEVEDIATNLFHVRGFITNSGTAATPFSATV